MENERVNLAEGEIAKLQLELGDVIIVTVPQRLSAASHAQLGEKLCEVFPGHDVIFLSDGTTLSVARPDLSPKTTGEGGGNP